MSMPARGYTKPARRSALERAEPLQRAQAGQEGILAAAGDDEPRQTVEAAADRPARDGEVPAAAAHQGILLGGVPDELPVVDPHRLDELELPPEVCAHEEEHEAPVLAVVLQDPLGQERAVA